MKRVLKGVLGGLLPSSEGVPAKRVLKKTEARGGLHTRPKPVSHEMGVEGFYAEKFLISRWKRVMDCCGEM
jgi:hypothetical protein